jgi:hypothetical protein
LDGGDDSRGSAAVDDDIVGLGRDEAEGEEVLAVCGWRLAVRR